MKNPLAAMLGVNDLGYQLAMLQATQVAYRDRSAQEVLALNEKLTVIGAAIGQLSAVVADNHARIEKLVQRSRGELGEFRQDARTTSAEATDRLSREIARLIQDAEGLIRETSVTGVEVVNDARRELIAAAHQSLTALEEHSSRDLAALSDISTAAKRRAERNDRRQLKQLAWMSDAEKALAELRDQHLPRLLEAQGHSTGERIDRLDGLLAQFGADVLGRLTQSAERDDRQLAWMSDAEKALAELRDQHLPRLLEAQGHSTGERIDRLDGVLAQFGADVLGRLTQSAERDDRQLAWMSDAEKALAELRDQHLPRLLEAQGHSTGERIDRLDGALAQFGADVLGRLTQSAERDDRQLAWMSDAEKALAELRDQHLPRLLEAQGHSTGERIDRLDGVLAQFGADVLGRLTQSAERDDRQLAWMSDAEKALAELRDQHLPRLLEAQGHSTGERIDRLDGALAQFGADVLALLTQSAERHEQELELSLETSRVLNDLRTGVATTGESHAELLRRHASEVVALIDKAQQHWAASERKHLDWTTLVGRMLGEIRAKDFPAVAAHFETFGGRLAETSNKGQAEALRQHTGEVVALVDKAQQQLAAIERKHLEWTTLVGRMLGEIRGKDFPALAAHFEAFGGVLAETSKVAAVRMAEEQRIHAALLREVLKTLPEPDGGAPAPAPVPAETPKGRRRKSSTPQLPASRAFGLRTASVDPELEGLLSLSQFVGGDLDLAIALSSITGPALRALFPAGAQQIVTVQCRSGLDLNVDASDIYGAGAFLGSLQEADDFAAFIQLVEPGAVVIDVGANFGLYTAHAALYAGSEGRVFAFEPAPDTFELLADNVARNGLSAQTTCANTAVAAKAGSSTFHVAADSAFSGLNDTGRSPIVRTIEARTVRLDNYAPLKAAGPVDLLKVDVEGAEGAVFAGARKLLADSPDPMVLFEYSHKNLDDARRKRLLDELTKLEATGYAIFARTSDRTVLARVAAGDLIGARSENLFMCRPGGARLSKLDQIIRDQKQPVPTPEQAAALALLRLQSRK